MTGFRLTCFQCLRKLLRVAAFFLLGRGLHWRTAVLLYVLVLMSFCQRIKMLFGAPSLIPLPLTSRSPDSFSVR